VSKVNVDELTMMIRTFRLRHKVSVIISMIISAVRGGKEKNFSFFQGLENFNLSVD
jgi:hypothetical protein